MSDIEISRRLVLGVWHSRLRDARRRPEPYRLSSQSDHCLILVSNVSVCSMTEVKAPARSSCT